jgi:hypothetical protein
MSENSKQGWQYRVFDEKRELEDKIAKLSNFIGSSVLPENSEDLGLLRKQFDVMIKYQRILEKRISRFPKEPHDVLNER